MFRLFNLKDFLRIYVGRSATFCTSRLDVNDILATHLGFNYDTIQKVIQRYKLSVNRIPKQQLIDNCRILQKSQVDLEKLDYLVSCLYLEPMVIKNRILLLEEMGVKKVSLVHIHQFPLSMRRSIKKFKNDHDIPSEQNIIENIFNSVGVTVDLPPIRRLSGHAKTADYYMACMTYYRTCHLKLHYKPLLESLHMRYLSFRQLTKLLDVLQNDIQFSKKLICKHRYLLTLCPDKVKHFINTLQDVKIDGKDIKTIVWKYPRILKADADNIKELLALFNELKISECAVLSYINVLKINKETFLERYRNILNTPELSLWLKHPKILYLIIYYDMIIRRIKYLRFLNRLDKANINTLSSSRNFFMRFAHNGTRVAAKKFLRFVLYNEIVPDKPYLLDYMIRHPHWKHISLFSIRTLIIYLKKHYSIEDICQNIHLVLYPKNAVIQMLEIVLKEYSQEKGYDFTPSQYLAICLYMLEKDNHFSGDAVWQIMYTNDNETNSLNAIDDLDMREFQNFLTSVDIDDNMMESINKWNSVE